MTRLIDADALKEYVGRVQLNSREKIFNLIDAQPTIDAVQVIRCADCKYYSTETEQTAVPNMRKCTWWRNIGTLPIDFCSRAERRGEE